MMTELRKIVIEGFPVERLPQELRDRLEGTAPVRVTIEQEATATDRYMPVRYGFARGMYADQGIDPTDFIRQLRDEWD